MVDQFTQDRVTTKNVTYEETIEEDEDCDWEDEPSDTVEPNKETSFLRTKPKVVSQHSLLTEGIHENPGGSAMHNEASFSSPESRRPRIPNRSCAPSPCSIRRGKEFPDDLQQALDQDGRPLVYFPDESREGIDTGFPVSSHRGW